MSDVPEITVYRGDTTPLPVAITQGDPPAAYDITGHTLSWLFSARRAGPVLLQIDVTDHSDPEKGLSELPITAANIVTIGGVGEYWLHGIDVDGDGNEVTDVVARLVVADRPQRS